MRSDCPLYRPSVLGVDPAVDFSPTHPAHYWDHEVSPRVGSRTELRAVIGRVGRFAGRSLKELVALLA
jgi:hypothetical protein